MGNKPFFSIVIPCYNSARTIRRLLDSLVNQHMKDDMEIILSDDNSTVPYQYIVDEYLDKLNIKQIKTDYNFGPCNTRQKGLELVTGEWILFIDHDDMLVPDSLKDIKQFIINNNCNTVVYTPISLVDDETWEEIDDYGYNSAALHGKFFNKEFWDKYEIHFKKDLYGAEDTYIISQLNYINSCYGEYYIQCDIRTYLWVDYKQSITHSKNYTENTFKDHLESTFYIFIDLIHKDKYPMDKNTGYRFCMDSLILNYILLKHFIHNNKIFWKKKNFILLVRLYKTFCKEFGVNKKIIQMILLQDNYIFFFNRAMQMQEVIGYIDYINPTNFSIWLSILELFSYFIRI